MPRRGRFFSGFGRAAAAPPAGLPAGCLVVCCLLAAGCGPRPESIAIDGSSTVFPISDAVAESFGEVRPDVRVPVGLSGTGGGMKKFTAGEIDICDASRQIKESEVAALEAAGVGFVEFEVAFDGIAVVVHPDNDWVDCLTVEQLAAIWRPEDPAEKWSDVDPSWPDERIALYGPGTDSGTFDYFTKAVVGEEKSCRVDFTASENDNVLVTGVSKDTYALAYFGFAYYGANAERLKLVAVESPAGECVEPTVDAIRSNEYAPLSRPLYIYVRETLLARPEGEEFVRFYLDRAGDLAGRVGYVAVSDEVAAQNRERLEAALAR